MRIEDGVASTAAAMRRMRLVLVASLLLSSGCVERLSAWTPRLDVAPSEGGAARQGGAVDWEDPSWPNGERNPYSHSPITYGINSSGLPPEAAGFGDSVRAAFAFWMAGGNERVSWNVSFEERKEAGKVDVRVDFVDADKVDCGGEVGSGCAEVLAYPAEDDNTSIFESTIVLLATRLTGTPHFTTYSDLEGVARHEIGHAIGFSHSKDKADVMYPSHEYKGSSAAPVAQEDVPILVAGAAAGLLIVVGLVWFGAGWIRSQGRGKLGP